MPIILFLVFIAVPLIELALIIRVGQALGFWSTIGLLFAMAALGTLMLNRQGVAVMRRASEAVAQGRPPVAAVIDGVFLSVAGLLLITPGFLSDILGLILLVPPLRRAIAGAVFRRLIDKGAVTIIREERREWPGGPPSGQRSDGNAGGVVIETDYERMPDPPADSSRRK